MIGRNRRKEKEGEGKRRVLVRRVVGQVTSLVACENWCFSLITSANNGGADTTIRGAEEPLV